MDDLTYLEYLPSTPELNAAYSNSPPRVENQRATVVYLSSSSSDSDSDSDSDDNDTHTLPLRPPLPSAHPQPYLPSTISIRPKTLTRLTMNPPSPRPALKVLLVLTPNPASTHEHALFEFLGEQFVKDFSPCSSSSSDSSSSKWTCVSLYAHFRAWIDEHARAGTGTETGVDIGSIHPLALRARLESETEVPWRLALPVLQELIDAEVAKGASKLVVAGLPAGHWEAAGAFCKRIADPNGILTFLPADASDVRVPAVYKSRTVKIKSTRPENTYSALLAALYARAFPAREKEVEAIDLAGESDADTEMEEG